jgi:hypothetical protein
VVFDDYFSESGGDAKGIDIGFAKIGGGGHQRKNSDVLQTKPFGG